LRKSRDGNSEKIPGGAQCVRCVAGGRGCAGGRCVALWHEANRSPGPSRCAGAQVRWPTIPHAAGGDAQAVRADGAVDLTSLAPLAAPPSPLRCHRPGPDTAVTEIAAARIRVVSALIQPHCAGSLTHSLSRDICNGRGA
jgi:hypothetical protein